MAGECEAFFNAQQDGDKLKFLNEIPKPDSPPRPRDASNFSRSRVRGVCTRPGVRRRRTRFH
jgi:hypothetical protein